MNHATPSEITMIASDDLEAPHLLIVEDEHDLALQLKAYMERQGCRVSLVDEGQKALEVVYQEQPDLIILNLNLPDIHGLTVCMRLKENRGLGFLPIIVLTDDHEELKRLEVRLSGADDYIAKPISERDLFLRVLALLRIKKQLGHLIAENHALAENLQNRNAELQETLADLRHAMEIAKQAEELKRHVIESVNHEFRTSLLQTKSAVSILVDVLSELSGDEKNRTLGDMATQAVGRIEEHVSNLTQLHLLDNLKLTAIVVDDAIRAAINDLRRSWTHRHHLDRIKHQASKVPPIVGDRRAVSRIVFLLLENALKFSPDESRVEVYAEKSDPYTICIAVHDYGIGIAVEDQKRIFEPFIQIHTGSTKPYRGIGVSLASAQMLAMSMNTKIELESTLGKGSKFFFRLPIADIFDL